MGCYYRHDTQDERRVLNRLWELVNDRFNYLTPTKKPIVYDTSTTPLDRLLQYARSHTDKKLN